jgi:hypothetical protein
MRMLPETSAKPVEIDVGLTSGAVGSDANAVVASATMTIAARPTTPH